MQAAHQNQAAEIVLTPEAQQKILDLLDQQIASLHVIETELQSLLDSTPNPKGSKE